jgi:hypothetical protein
MRAGGMTRRKVKARQLITSEVSARYASALQRENAGMVLPVRSSSFSAVIARPARLCPSLHPRAARLR